VIHQHHVIIGLRIVRLYRLHTCNAVCARSANKGGIIAVMRHAHPSICLNFTSTAKDVECLPHCCGNTIIMGLLLVRDDARQDKDQYNSMLTECVLIRSMFHSSPYLVA